MKNIQNVGGAFNITPQTQRQLGQLNTNLSNIGNTTKRATSDIERFGASAAASLRRFAGFTIFASSFFTLTKAIKSSLTEAIAFQRELVKIRQVSGVSLKDLSALTEEVTNLSTSLGVSSKRLLNSSQVLAQAGFTIDEVNKAMRTLAKIELAPTFDNITDAAEGMIAIMGQFGTSADEFEKQFSAINTVSAKFAVESSDIITAIRRTGGAFSAAGGSINDLIALFTSVRSSTRESAETISTGFRTIFTRLQRTRTIDFLKNLGIELRNTEGQFVGPLEAVRRLSIALDKLDSRDVRFAQITEELGGFRQIGKVIPLIKQFDVAQQALIVAQQSQNSLTIDAEKAQAALAIRITKVREEFEALIRKISENDAFQLFTNSALQLASALIKIGNAIEPLLPLLSALGAFKIASAAPRFLGAFSGGIPKFASGGPVAGSGNKDDVPAFLMPGEFVLNKKAVRNIGIRTLDRLNSGVGIQKFATGGRVKGGLQSPFLNNATSTNNILGAGAIALTIVSLSNNFDKLNKETQELVGTVEKSIGALAGTFLLLRGGQQTFGINPRQQLEGLRENQKGLNLSTNRGQRNLNNLSGRAASVSGDILNRETEIARLTKNLRINRAFLNSNNPAITSQQRGIAQSEFTIDTIKLRREIQQLKQLRPQSDDLATQVAGQSKAQTVRENELNALNRQIKSLERSELILNSFNLAAATVSAGLLALGNTLENSARSDLRLGGRDVVPFARAKAFSGGGAGVGIGATFGGIIGGGLGATAGGVGAVPGAAIGTSIGGTIGGSIGAIVGFERGVKEANRIIESTDFAKKIDKFSKVLDNITSGRSTATSQIGPAVLGIRQLQSRLINTSAEDKETTEGQIGSAVVGIDNFISKIAETSRSFQQLEGLVGKDVLQTFAAFTNVPFDKLRERFTQQIEQQNKAIKITSVLTAEQEAQFKQLQEFNSLTGALQDAQTQLKLFGGRVQELDNFLAGSTGRTNVEDISDIFSRPGSIIDKSLLTTAVGQVTGGLGGRGNVLGQEFLKATDALAKLPDILFAAGNRPFGEGGEFADEFENVLKSQVSGISDSLVATLKANVLQFRGDEAKDEKIFKALRENPSELIKAVGGGVLEDLAKFFEDNSRLLNNQINQLASLYEKRRQIETRLIESINDTVGLREGKSNFGAEARGLPIPSNAGFERQRFLNILGPNAAAFGRGNPRSIGNQVISSQNKVLQLNTQLQSAEGSARNDLLKQIEDEKDQIERLTNALKFQTDVTARNANLQQQLERVQRQNQAKFGFARDAAFGDNDSRRNLARGALAGGLLARTGDINKVPQDLRGDALSFLERFEDVVLPFLGNKSGKDVIRDTVEKSLINAGLDPKKAKEVALKQTTSQEQQLIDAINGNFTTAIGASTALTEIIKNIQSQELKEISRNVNDIAKLLERNFAITEVGRLSNQRTNLTGEVNQLQTSFKSFGQITKLIGGSPDVFNNIRNALPQIRDARQARLDLEAQRKTLSPVLGLVNRFDFSRPDDRSKGLTQLFSGFDFNKRFGGQQAANVNLTEDDFNQLKGRFASQFGDRLTGQIFNQDLSKQVTIGETSFDEFAKLIRQRIGQTSSDINQGFRTAGENDSSLAKQIGFNDNSQIGQLFTNFEQLSKLFSSIPENATFDGLQNANIQAAELARVIEGLNTKINQLNIQFGLGRNSGGTIPGSGNTDTVPAMLTPGEFVINKQAAAAIGEENLHALNNMQFFASGGRVRGRRSFAERQLELKQRRLNSIGKVAFNADAAKRRVAFIEKQKARNAANRVNLRHSQNAILSFTNFQNRKRGDQPFTLGEASPAQIGSTFAVGFNKGGRVKFANGGAVGGGTLGISPQAIESFTRFGENINRLTQSMDNFPRTVSMDVRHTIEVIHNGAAVFQSLNEQFTQLVESTVSKELNKMLKSKFPDIGGV